jgi:hypothetical protein
MADIKRIWNVLLPLGFCILLVPLMYALVANPELIQTWLGVRPDLGTPLEIAKNIAKVPLSVLIRSDPNPVMTLGRLPFLDIGTTILGVLGAYWYVTQRKLDRTKLIAGGLVLGTVLVGLMGIMTSTIVMPFVYLLAAGGITFLLQQWFTVFPRNPLARGVGIGLVVAVVLASSFYNTQRYFVAWPNTPATKQAFSQQLQ